MTDETTLLAAHAKYGDALLSRPGVHAVGIGLKMRGGELTTELAIVCLVEKKLDLSELDQDDAIPSRLDDVPTDVQESPMLQPFTTDPSQLQTSVRPLVGGLQVQLTRPNNTTVNGTLGFIGNFNGIMVAVSNQHVMTPSGTTVFQPANSKNQNIGTVTLEVLSQDVDAAYVLLLSGASGQTSVEFSNGNGYAPVRVAGSYSPGLSDLPYPVWKTGRTTGTTRGQITALNLRGTRGDDGWQFVNQLLIQNTDGGPFSQPGDSGSAVLDFQSRVVGLLWGANSAGTNNGASPIVPVLQQLGIQVGVGGNARQPVTVPGFDTLLAGLGSTERGKRIADFLSTHVPEVCALVREDRRVGTVWTRRRGHQICNQVIENLATGEVPLPSTLAGAPAHEVFDALHKVLVKQGSPCLAAAVEAIHDDFVWLIDRAHAEIVN